MGSIGLQSCSAASVELAMFGTLKHLSHPPVGMEFHRLNDEPAADFAALLIHRDGGPGRTLNATALQVGRSESTLRRVANRWRWADRLQAFDSAVLTQVAATGAHTAEVRHRQQLLDPAGREARHWGSVRSLNSVA